MKGNYKILLLTTAFISAQDIMCFNNNASYYKLAACGAFLWYGGFLLGCAASRPMRTDPVKTIKGSSLQFSLKDFIGAVPKEITSIIYDMKSSIARYVRAYHNTQLAKGLILYGKPGIGKTFLAKCIAGELGIPWIATTGPAIVSGRLLGAGTTAVTSLFAEARQQARKNCRKSCVVIIDEADSLLGKRTDSPSCDFNPVPARDYNATVNTLLAEVDGFSQDDLSIYVIACTNSRISTLDEAITRAGRFENQVQIETPSENGVFQLLAHYFKKLKVLSDHEQVLSKEHEEALKKAAGPVHQLYQGQKGYVSPADIQRLVSSGISDAYRAEENGSSLITRAQEVVKSVSTGGSVTWIESVINYFFRARSQKKMQKITATRLNGYMNGLRTSGVLFNKVLREIYTRTNQPFLA